MSHTPGPWVVRHTKGQEADIDAPSGDARLSVGTWWGLATVYGHDDDPKRGTEVMTANATLIAASPDLLEALEAFVDDVDKDVIRVRPSDRNRLIETLSKANTAIAKARGEK